MLSHQLSACTYWFNPSLLNVGQEGVVCSHALRGGDWVWLVQIPVAFWLTSYWLASPVAADPRGVAEERPALPKVGVPSLFSS
jgi:hypothetical protein